MPLISVGFFSFIWSASLNKRMSHCLALSMILMFSLTVAILYTFLSNLSRSVCVWSMFNKSTRCFTPSQSLIWLYIALFLFLKACSFILHYTPDKQTLRNIIKYNNNNKYIFCIIFLREVFQIILNPLMCFI